MGIDLRRIEGEFLQAFLRDGGMEPVSKIIAGGRIVDAIPVLDDRTAFTNSNCATLIDYSINNSIKYTRVKDAVYQHGHTYHSLGVPVIQSKHSES